MAKRKAPLPNNMVQVMLPNVRVYVDGPEEKYLELCNVVEQWRVLFRHVDGYTGMFEIGTAGIRWEKPRKMKRKKEEKPLVDETKLRAEGKTGKEIAQAWKKAKEREEQKRLMVKMNTDLAKRIAAKIQRTKPGGGRYYYARPEFMRFARILAEDGGPTFGTHIWDELHNRLAGERDKKMPDYGNVSRSVLLTKGIFEPIRVSNMGIPFVVNFGAKKPKIYAWCIDDERGMRVRVQWGKKKDAVDLVLHGWIKTLKEKPYQAKLDVGRRNIFRKLASGQWQFQTPVLNMRKGRKGKVFTLQIPYTRPASFVDNLEQDRTLEVCFQHLMGSELPRKKHDTGKDDEKHFVIHCLCKSPGSRKRIERIAVNNVIPLLRVNAKRQHQLELRRDCARRWSKRHKKPVREAINGLARRRKAILQDINHQWSKQIVRTAEIWRCKTIKVFGLPNGTTQGLLLDGTTPWEWGQLLRDLNYKSREKGIELLKIEEPDLIEAFMEKIDLLGTEEKEGPGEEKEHDVSSSCVVACQ